MDSNGILVTDKLGLAAWLQMQGAELVAVDGKIFTFKTESTEREAEVQYMNTESYRHDTVVVHLRNLTKASYTDQQHQN